MSELLLPAAYLVSISAVLLYSINYFNQPAYKLKESGSGDAGKLLAKIEPAPPLYMTDRSRYYFNCFIFVVITEVIFFVLTRLLAPIPMDQLLGVGQADALLPLMAAAIILGVFQLNKVDRLSRLKWVRPFIDMYKQNLHISAKIPQNGRMIYSYLVDNDINHKSGTVKQYIEETLKNSHYIVEGENVRTDIKATDFSNNRLSITSKWARLSYLITIVEGWGKEPKYSKSLRHQTLHWDEIHNNYRALVEKFRFFQTSENYPGDQESALNTEVELVLLNTYRLISCLLFLACKDPKEPFEVLRSIGFTVVVEDRVRIPGNSIVRVGGFVFSAIVLGAVVAGVIAYLLGVKALLAKDSAINAATIMSWVAYGVPMHLVPVVFVLMAKKKLVELGHWPLVRKQQAEVGDESPWGVYLVVTLMGYLLAGTVVLLIALVSKGEVVLVAQTVKAIYVYALGTLVTGFFLCYRLDSPLNPAVREKLSVKLSGALLQGSLTALALVFSFAYVENQGGFNFFSMPLDKQLRLLSYTTVTFLIGVAVFWSSRLNLQVGANLNTHEMQVQGVQRGELSVVPSPTTLLEEDAPDSCIMGRTAGQPKEPLKVVAVED